LKSSEKGLFKVNRDLLFEINAIDDVTIPSLPNEYRVESGQKVAASRIVPLVTPEENILEVERLCQSRGPVFRVQPYKKLKVGLIITAIKYTKAVKRQIWSFILKKWSI
jgi:hypothetical protein